MLHEYGLGTIVSYTGSSQFDEAGTGQPEFTQLYNQLYPPEKIADVVDLPKTSADYGITDEVYNWLLGTGPKPSDAVLGIQSAQAAPVPSGSNVNIYGSGYTPQGQPITATPITSAAYKPLVLPAPPKIPIPFAKQQPRIQSTAGHATAYLIVAGVLGIGALLMLGKR